MMGIHDNTRRQLHWAPKTILLKLICRAMRLLSGGSEQWAFELNYAKSNIISLANNMPENKVVVCLLLFTIVRPLWIPYSTVVHEFYGKIVVGKISVKVMHFCKAMSHCRSV